MRSGSRGERPREASPAADVREMYETSADSYATMMDAEIELPMYDAALARLAERVAAIEGPLIDTSCGSGHMLARYRERFDTQRPVVGIDLSPRMVEIARDRLGEDSDLRVGDMRELTGIADGSAAALMSFFALHHLAAADASRALAEWARVVTSSGQLLVATWAGEGAIDYGGEADIVAFRYALDEVAAWVEEAGFGVDRARVHPVEGMGMDALYIDGTRTSR